MGFDDSWHDLTDYLEKPDKVIFTFGSDDEQSEMIDSIGIQRGLSSTFQAYGEAYLYIRRWLIDHQNSAIHSIQVRVTDAMCKQYLGIWELKSGNLRWCDDDECKIDFNLNEYKPEINCLQTTMIYDNHRTWFPEDGVPGGKTDPLTGLVNPDYIHPVFRYCDDIKPQALQNFIFTFVQSLIGVVASLVAPILAIANILQDLINAVFGSGTVTFADDLEDDVAEKVTNFLQVMLGCNRMHPSPFVRTYFINGCSKCKTATGQRIEFVSDIFNDPDSDYKRYYDTAHLFAPVKKGLLQESQVNDDKRDWIHDNRPIHSVIDYAYTLKDIFNAKFKLEDNKFYFHRKDTFPPEILFDFTGDDKKLLLKPVCYSSNVPKRFASTVMTWGQDAIDISGNEARHRYNGQKDWNASLPIPDKWNYEGIKEIKTELYSVARFALDGIERRLLFAFQTGWLDTTLSWAENAMLMQQDETTMGKLLCYDDESEMKDAHVVKVHRTDYNIDYWKDDWIYNHQGTTDDYFVYNWPLYFFEQTTSYADNLYSMHVIDNPTVGGFKNKAWEVVLELCCASLTRIVFDAGYGDGIVVHLDHLIILPDGDKGAIRNVVFDYENSEIRLTGEIKYTA